MAQTGQVDKALDIFLSLIKEDIDFIINTDPVDDDCPCPELVFELGKHQEENTLSPDFLLIMGMMWLYCNIHKSYDYFLKAAELNKDHSRIKSTLAFIKARLAEERTEA